MIRLGDSRKTRGNKVGGTVEGLEMEVGGIRRSGIRNGNGGTAEGRKEGEGTAEGPVMEVGELQRNQI